MTSRTLQPIAERSDYLNVSWSIGSWLFSTDHKRIALLYMVSLTLLFFVGGAAAVMMRLELLTPGADMVSMGAYNRLFTVHGTIMVFFFLVPSIPAVLGNFLIPMMIGARDLAFPRLNLASWYLFMAGAALALSSILYWSVDTGWTFYAPYSTAYANPGVIPMTLGIFLAGFATIFTALNFIVTVHTMRAPGLGWLRLPLFIWSLYATSIIIVLGTPVLAITLALLVIEKLWGIGIFDPALGGDPVLYQHLFWFYSHPAVYIMILPGFGVVSEIIPCFARKRIFGYLFIALASIAIAVLGFLVWGHHMFVSGQSFFTATVFSLLSFLIAIPSAIKVFNWTATLHKGLIELTTPMLYALGFVGLFVIGGLTGLFVASLVIDVHVHDTYFVIAHFHYIMVGGMVLAYMGGIHFWWPKISGRLYPEGWGIFSAILIFFGFNLTFFPQFVLGYLGMPRRYATYAEEFQVLHVMSSAGASILSVGYVLPLCYLLWTLTRPPDAPPNPWRATGLEWQTPSPPPPHNFDKVPLVTEGPYAYSAVTDTFIPQAELLHESDEETEPSVERPNV